MFKLFTSVTRNLRKTIADRDQVIALCADFIKQKEARIAELSDMLSDNHDLVTKMRDQLAGRLEIIDHDTKDLIKLRTENDRLSARIVELQDPFGLELDLDSDHIVAESKLWQPEE